MEKVKYTGEGYLIVSEMDSCSRWKKDSVPCPVECRHDCFYCAFSNFRQDEFLRNLVGVKFGEKLYSVCHNEYNRK